MYKWLLKLILFLTPPCLVLAEIKTYEGTYTSTISYQVSQTLAGSIEILGDYPTPGMPELSVRVKANDGFQFIGFGETTTNEQGGVIDYGDGRFTIPEISINGILTAYFSPDNPPPVVKNLLTLSTTIGGAVTGGGYHEKGVFTTIEALPSSGYLFSNWSGDTSGSSNPLSITMDSDKTITANFIQDLNDDDGDGITNFAELATHGTDPSKQDTDGDGILDGKEIEIGSDPKTSDSAVLNYGKTEGIAEGKAIGRSEGEQSVLSNPSAYNLFTSEQYEDALQSLDTNATPYTTDWFYTPKRGWMWSEKGVYPYFFDANSSNWMYFQSGHENPRFYHYGTKEWMTLE